MSHVFISYSHKDRDYCRTLTSYLLSKGFDVWIDDRIDYGTDWLNTIIEAVQECAAFIVVMTPASKNSHWVRLEVSWAIHWNKPIFPLLRAGENWPIFFLTEYVDVTDGSLPDERFIASLTKQTSPHRQRGIKVTKIPHVHAFTHRKLDDLIPKDLFPKGENMEVLIARLQQFIDAKEWEVAHTIYQEIMANDPPPAFLRHADYYRQQIERGLSRKKETEQARVAYQAVKHFAQDDPWIAVKELQQIWSILPGYDPENLVSYTPIRNALLNWYRIKDILRTNGVESLISEFTSYPKDDVLITVQNAFRFSASALQEPHWIAHQVYGRLLPLKQQEIRQLREQIAHDPPRPWLRLLYPSLTPPDEHVPPLREHEDAVWALTPLDDQHLISASEDGTLLVWNVYTGQIITKFTRHKGGVHSVSPLDGLYVISGARDATLRVWNAQTGKQWGVLHGHKNMIFSVATINGEHVVSASRDRSLKIWDVPSKKAIHTLLGHKDWVRDVGVLNARYIVSASDDETLRVWDISTGQTIRVLKGHQGNVNTLAVLSMRHIISGSDDGTLRLWNVWTGETLQIFFGHQAPIHDIAILDNEHILSASYDQTLRVWDMATGVPRAIFRADYPLLCCAAMPDQQTVAAGDASGFVHILSFER